jgi:2-dehydropantoate 2-reductase
VRIAIVGSGGVGGYFGGRLAEAGADVTFIARGEHLAALRRNGLRVESPAGDLALEPVRAVETPAEVGPVDIVLFAVKLYDTLGALATLPSLIGPSTMVVPLQNGIDTVDTLRETVGGRHVAGGTCYLAAVIRAPGIIRHTAMGKMIFGPLEGTHAPQLEQLLEVCKHARFEAELSRQIEVDIWSKFVRLTVFSGMTAVTRCPIGLLRDDPDLSAMMQAATLESIVVARASGISLPPTLLEEIDAATAALPPQARSSMLEDLERGRPLELPWLSGAVVRLGERHNVATPIHRFITAVLTPHVGGRLQLQHPADTANAVRKFD